jgi:membrane-bound metal-dependent hydrolase YbcI (DUF457 family)
MASPVGHALVGMGLAAIAAHATGTSSSAGLWVGAVVASGLPDLDFAGVAFGLPPRRVHRFASHSFVVLAALILIGAWAWVRLPLDLEPGVGLSWAVALLSHPLLDLLGTGPATAARGYGIGLFWPLSSRRWFLAAPILPSADLRECRYARDVWKAVLPEVRQIGPASILGILFGYLF